MKEVIIKQSSLEYILKMVELSEEAEQDLNECVEKLDDSKHDDDHVSVILKITKQ